MAVEGAQCSVIWFSWFYAITFMNVCKYVYQQQKIDVVVIVVDTDIETKVPLCLRVVFYFSNSKYKIHTNRNGI